LQLLAELCQLSNHCLCYVQRSNLERNSASSEHFDMFGTSADVSIGHLELITLRVSCGAVYCNRSCLCVCVFVCGWVCYHDNSKLILTKPGL